MKTLFVSLLTLVVMASVANAQNAAEEMKRLVDQRDFLSAYRYAAKASAENPKNVAVQLMAYEVYDEMEKPDSAIVFAKKAYDAEETVATIRAYGRALTNLRRFAEAVKVFENTPKDKRNDVMIQLGLADTYIAADSLKAAERIVIRAREANKNMAEPYVVLGDLYYAQKVYSLAKDNYEEALAKNPAITSARIKLATVYYRMANMETDEDLSNELFTRSLREWNAVTKADTLNATAFYEQGKILFLAKKFDDAARSFYRYSILRPEGHLGRWFLAQSLFRTAQWDSAIVPLEMSIRAIDSVREKGSIMLAQVYFEKKMFDKANAAYKALPNGAPLEQNDYERWGYSAINSKDTLVAIEKFRTAVYGAQKKCNLMNRYGFLLQSRKLYPDAIQIFRKRIEDCPDSFSIRARYFIGNAFFADNKPDSAIVAFKDFIANDKNSVLGRVMIARSFSSIKQADSAKAWLVQAMDVAKANPTAPKNEIDAAFQEYCSLLIDAKDFAGLLKNAKSWIELNPDSINGNLFMAIGYQGSQDQANACKYYREVLKKDPENKVAKQNVKSLGC